MRVHRNITISQPIAPRERRSSINELLNLSSTIRKLTARFFLFGNGVYRCDTPVSTAYLQTKQGSNMGFNALA